MYTVNCNYVYSSDYILYKCFLRCVLDGHDRIIRFTMIYLFNVAVTFIRFYSSKLSEIYSFAYGVKT